MSKGYDMVAQFCRRQGAELERLPLPLAHGAALSHCQRCRVGEGRAAGHWGGQTRTWISALALTVEGRNLGGVASSWFPHLLTVTSRLHSQTSDLAQQMHRTISAPLPSVWGPTRS